MAEHPKEVSEITRSCNALMLNLGNITDTRMDSMLISAKTAYLHHIPFVLDMVGISCSGLRRNYAEGLLSEIPPTVIKGNCSEINSLVNSDYYHPGVDSQAFDVKYIDEIAIKASLKYNTIVLVSGKTDIITDGKKLFHMKNGCKRLSSVTGTGCILGALCACFLSEDNSILSAVASCALLGICGEKADGNKGNGSFMISLMDNLSLITDIESDLRMEEVEIERK